MKPRDFVLEQLRHHETQPVPFTLPFEDEVGLRLDEYYGGPAWRQRLTPYLVAFTGVDNVSWEPIDDTWSRDVYGGLWRMDRRPFHLEQWPLAEPTLAGFAYPDMSRLLRPEVKEKARQTCAEHPDSFLVAHIGWGIWETCWHLRGFANALMDSIAEPEFFTELLDLHTAMHLAFVDWVADLPIDAIMWGEDWGTQRGVMLGPDRWRKFLKPRWAKLYDAAHAKGKVAISHCCGSIADIMPDIVEIGLDVLESVQVEAAGMDPYALKREYGDKITFWGGLGSQSIIPFGQPEEIHREVRNLCKEMGKGGGYILAPVKLLQPETPIENAVAVLEAFTHQV